MRTQAAVLVELGKPLELAELEVPPLRAGQVLVEIAYAAICHTQLLEARGGRGADPFLPHCLGHEATARVLETGDGVEHVKAGQRVVLSWIKGLGANVPGTTYSWGTRTVNAGAVTTFQRHAVVSENRLTPLPEGLAMERAVLLGCALPTGMGAVVNTARARAGESVAVFGTGGIGLCSIIGAVAQGCAPVIGIDPNPARRDLALRFGATHVVDSGQSDAAQVIAELSSGGVDVAIEASGRPDVMRAALEAVRPRGGRAVVIGNARFGERLTLDPRAFNDGKSLLGCWGGDSVPERDLPIFSRAIANGGVDVGPLLSAPLTLAAINDALAALESGRVGRPLIDLSLN